jgi:hypothetical protein
VVFVARHLRYDLPEPVADLLGREEVWNTYAPFDKPIVLIGEYGSLLVKGDWFVRPKTERVD